MAAITLTDGDFGAGDVMTFGAETMYLPDRAHPGMREAVSFVAVAGMERIAGDRSGQLKQAVKLGAGGFLTAGPVGLVAGMLAVGKAADAVFTVALHDGRTFTATTDAVTYANLHAAQVAARGAARLEEGDSAADEIIARYVARKAGKLPAPAEAPPPAEPEQTAPAPSRRPAFGKRQRPA